MLTYGEIWKTLYAIDVSPFIKKKMELSFLSWSHAWKLLMEHYPDATYQFHYEPALADGTMSVVCTVCIPSGDDKFTRTMWLPVMDAKMNALPYPDARDISDTQMRCLVKTLGMFGLGISLWLREEEPEKRERPAPKERERPAPRKFGAAARAIAASLAPMPPSTSPEAVVTPVTPLAAEPEAPAKADGNNIVNAENAADVVKKLLMFANEFCMDIPALMDFWRKNKQLIDILDHNFNEQYETLKQGFTALKTKLTGEENANR